MANEAQWIVGDRGGQAFALPLAKVLRVASSPRICEVPLAPTGYVGVIDFDGAAVPVWDPFPESADAMWGATVIVADCAGGRVGFLCDVPPQVRSGMPSSHDAAGLPVGSMWNGGVRLGPTDVPVLDPVRFGN
jgi:chemotaxis signal transduction protein